jgi:hypothetical protein
MNSIAARWLAVRLDTLSGINFILFYENIIIRNVE